MSIEKISDIGHKLKELRKKDKLSLREVCSKAGVAPSYLSNLERGNSSPTLATLRKILKALNLDLKTFFTSKPDNIHTEGFVFRRENMRTAIDGTRRYTFVLPRRDDIKGEVLDEYLMPGETGPEFETLDCDISGVILTGTLELEIEGDNKYVLRSGDAFYITANRKHRGRCISPEPVHLITMYIPPRY